MRTNDADTPLRTKPHTAEPEQKTPDWSELKLALNNAVWMHAPASTTLAQAEEATCRAITHLSECYNRANSLP